MRQSSGEMPPMDTAGFCRSLSEEEAAHDSENWSDCPSDQHECVPLRLRGGKGGFGSMLRAQGGRMASQKTTNFEACRDLSGRRLKTVNDAKKIADFKATEVERKRKQKEELRAKIEKGLKEPEVKKIRFDDTEFVKDHEQVLDEVKDTVKKGILLVSFVCLGGSELTAEIALRAKPLPIPKKASQRPAVKKGIWDEESGSDSDSSAAKGADLEAETDAGDGEDDGSDAEGAEDGEGGGG
ncbi:hypothetical protein HDU82_001729, partial [Entophlyctis luteolus]